MSGEAGPVVSVEQARGVISTTLSDTALEDIIDREEAWLARRIGPLLDERTQEFWISQGADGLILQRPTLAVTVTDGDVELEDDEVRLLAGGTRIERAEASWQGPSVLATYAPSDEQEVVAAILELVRISVDETGTGALNSETIGGYSYTRSAPSAGLLPETRRSAVLRSLAPYRGPGTIHLRSSAAPDRVTR